MNKIAIIYSRLALSGLNQHTEAIKCYKKGIELDPNNQNFKTNLEIAEEKARTAGGTFLHNYKRGGFELLL